MRGDWEAGNLHSDALTLRMDEQPVSLIKKTKADERRYPLSLLYLRTN